MTRGGRHRHHVDPHEIFRAAKTAYGHHIRHHGIRPGHHDDAMSDAMLGALQASHRWDPQRGALFPYLFTRARGAIFDGFRRRSHLNRTDQEAKVDIDDLPAENRPAVSLSELVENFGQDVAADPRGEAPYRRVEARHDMDLALEDCLDDREETVVRQVDLEGRRLREVGADLGITESRVSQIRKGALAKLRSCWPHHHH